MPRTLTLGVILAVGVGATLLAPSSAVAADPPTCVAETLTELQLNHLLVDINAATLAEAEGGFRATSHANEPDKPASTTVAIKDAATGWFQQTTTTTGVGRHSFRYYSGGIRFELLTTANPAERPPLAVLGRSSIWLNLGMSYSDDLPSIMRPPTQQFMVPNGGTCSASDTGLTLVFAEQGRETTLVTDATLARTSSASALYGQTVDTTTIAYGQFDIESVAVADKITPAKWTLAKKSAVQRAALTAYAKKVAAGAKAAAAKAKRAVRASDVKAVKPTLPTGAKRSNLSTGISVTTLDAYTRKTLRITVTVAQQTVRIADNW